MTKTAHSVARFLIVLAILAIMFAVFLAPRVLFGQEAGVNPMPRLLGLLGACEYRNSVSQEEVSQLHAQIDRMTVDLKAAKAETGVAQKALADLQKVIAPIEGK